MSDAIRWRFAKRLYGAVVPVRTRSALWQISVGRWARGKLLPFTVTAPQSQSTLHCCVAYNKHGAYCIPVSALHHPVALSVFAGGVWEPETIELMVAHCTAGDIVHAGVSVIHLDVEGYEERAFDRRNADDSTEPTTTDTRDPAD
jgi:hypothetical protein